ncbi:MAG: hypothetical protein Q8N18_07555 [Opitutaceae bacterium]|nr:hypothetical protein [Opitutaceae bacterium]
MSDAGITGGPAQPDTTLVIEGGRIVSLGKHGSVAIPSNAKVVEAKDKFLIRKRLAGDPVGEK